MSKTLRLRVCLALWVALTLVQGCTNYGGIVPYQSVRGKISVTLTSPDGSFAAGISGRFAVRDHGGTTYLSLSGPLGLGSHGIGWPGATADDIKRIPGLENLRAAQ